MIVIFNSEEFSPCRFLFSTYYICQSLFYILISLEVQILVVKEQQSLFSPRYKYPKEGPYPLTFICFKQQRPRQGSVILHKYSHEVAHATLDEEMNAAPFALLQESISAMSPLSAVLGLRYISLSPYPPQSTHKIL